MQRRRDCGTGDGSSTNNGVGGSKTKHSDYIANGDNGGHIIVFDSRHPEAIQLLNFSNNSGRGYGPLEEGNLWH
jgi:hypothetical protein